MKAVRTPGAPEATRVMRRMSKWDGAERTLGTLRATGANVPDRRENYSREWPERRQWKCYESEWVSRFGGRSRFACPEKGTGAKGAGRLVPGLHTTPIGDGPGVERAVLSELAGNASEGREIEVAAPAFAEFLHHKIAGEAGPIARPGGGGNGGSSNV
jgi:hypothetical protein